MLLLLAACADPPPPESDVEPAGAIEQARAGSHAVEVRRTGVGPGTEVLVDGVTALGAPWNADRAAVGPDGTLAFVSGISGLASVWVRRPGAEPVQLTNIGLDGAKRRPGQPPAGFVPPPFDGPPAFDGDDLVWTGPDGPHRARWR